MGTRAYALTPLCAHDHSGHGSERPPDHQVIQLTTLLRQEVPEQSATFAGCTLKCGRT